jgi:hypothetical protein
MTPPNLDETSRPHQAFWNTSVMRRTFQDLGRAASAENLPRGPAS